MAMTLDARPVGEVLGESIELIAAVVARLEPGELSGDDARRLSELFARGERVCAAGKALAATRVAECGTWTGSAARSPEEWLAKVSGVGLGAATAQMDMAERLAGQPELDQALRAGQMSMAQATEISQAAAGSGDPGTAGRLIEHARQGGSHRSLQDRCRQAVNTSKSAEQDRDRLERLRRSRFFKTWVDRDGCGHGQFRMAPDGYARFMSMFKPFQDLAFDQARKQGRRDGYLAHAADGLMAMAAAAHRATTSRAPLAAPEPDAARPGPPAMLIVIADLAALRRGYTEGEETMEIVGLGSVPVSLAREFVDDAFLAFVLKEGVDIRQVAHAGRRATALQRTALWVRDRACVICGSLHRLEIDHVDEWSQTHITRLDQLAFLCRRCHHLKTYKHWKLLGGPGHFRLEPPGAGPDPPPDP